MVVKISVITKNKIVTIVIVTRFPVPGEVKTRLIPTLGADGAAELQRKMTEFTVKQAVKTGFTIQIHYTGGTRSQMQKWLGCQYEYAEQVDGDLGQKLKNASLKAFEQGANKVLLIGCDCPDNHFDNMLEAIKLLDKTSCVIGPAADGGYYLLGLNSARPELFEGVVWGTKVVLEQTLARLKEYKLLKVLNDVDEPADIPAKISVIVPVLNEEANIKLLLQQLQDSFNIEVIIVDGGSKDQTKEVAIQAGVMVINGKQGRALQMNQGAKLADSEIIIFLHADSILPKGWDGEVRRVIKQQKMIMGYFQFEINESFRGKKLVEWGVNIRSRYFKRPYGDQGFFFWKTDFWEIGGFVEVPILEDLLLVKKAARYGKICCTNLPLKTSGRRWLKLGFLKTLLINQMILLLATLGVDLKILKSLYRN